MVETAIAHRGRFGPLLIALIVAGVLGLLAVAILGVRRLVLPRRALSPRGTR